MMAGPQVGQAGPAGAAAHAHVLRGDAAHHHRQFGHLQETCIALAQFVAQLLRAQALGNHRAHHLELQLAVRADAHHFVELAVVRELDLQLVVGLQQVVAVAGRAGQGRQALAQFVLDIFRRAALHVHGADQRQADLAVRPHAKRLVELRRIGHLEVEFIAHGKAEPRQRSGHGRRIGGAGTGRSSRRTGRLGALQRHQPHR